MRFFSISVSFLFKFQRYPKANQPIQNPGFQMFLPPSPMHEKIIIPSYKACEMASQTMKFLSLLNEAMSLKTSLFHPPKAVVANPPEVSVVVPVLWVQKAEVDMVGIMSPTKMDQQSRLDIYFWNCMLPKRSVSLVITAEKEMSDILVFLVPLPRLRPFF